LRNGSGVSDVKGLVGKKVATPFVSTAHYSLLFMLNHEHVDATKVNLLNLQPPEIAAAFARGDIDAAYVWDPVLTKAKENGKILIDSSEVAKLGGPTFVAWITRKDYAASHAKLLTAFAKTTLDAFGHFRAKPADFKAGAPLAKIIADFNGAKVEDIFDEIDGPYYPLADEGVGRLSRQGVGRRRGCDRCVPEAAEAGRYAAAKLRWSGDDGVRQGRGLRNAVTPSV